MSSPKEWDVKMSDINLTSAVRQNLLSLQGTASMMAKTQNKLSTGNKVNSALDNPSNFFTASSLNSRASDLGNLMDSMKSGIKTIEAADNGLSSITKTLESMQSTLRQARQDKSFETASYTLTSTTSKTAKIDFTGGAFGSGAGSIKLATDSAKAVLGTTAFAGATATAVATATTENTATLTGSGAFTAVVAGTAGTVTLGYGSDTVDVTLAAGDDAAATVTKVQAAIDGNAALKGKLTASQAAGVFEIKATSAEDKTITLVDGTGDVAGTFGGFVASTNAGSDGKFSMNVSGVDVSLSKSDFATPATPTIDEAIKAINVQLGNAGSKFKAVDALDAAGAKTGKLQIQADSTSAGDLKVSGEGAKTLFGAASNTAVVAGTDDVNVHLAKTVDDLVNEINNSSTLSTKVKASNDSGKLRLQNLSTQDLKMDGISSSGVIDASSSGVAKIGGNTVRSDLANQFNELRDQLDKLADDASFNGINLLRGDKLTITFNETSTSSIAILAKDGNSVDSTSLGVPTTVEAKDLDSDTTIDSVLTKVKTA
ncbi:MAG: hypothetical protein H6Q99_1383, partial [Proteobacteria bacterium]|nr:hypothetical protein [Pseudomonadota bacterium]